MPDNRHRRRLLDRLRSRTTAATAPDRVPIAAPAPETLRREHLFGSQYRVRMSFAELMQTRGCTGERVLRGLAGPTTTQRQRDAATWRAGYRPGEVLWPS
ncbi:hypothetical protein MHEL_60090 [Mycolicibacterium helvum]|uniref:Uncharacterized protein n=1 Tax=Mycolicibacterium helvum TaxID=1534349 RepID=A0A7I7TI06_9MYCO|nr:hypothetical protein MHEL_60090 [Mycolicibacterium helvum]